MLDDRTQIVFELGQWNVLVSTSWCIEKPGIIGAKEYGQKLDSCLIW